MLGAGVGESAIGGSGLSVQSTGYNTLTNQPPLWDGLGKKGLCYKVSVGGERDFSPREDIKNVLTLAPEDLVFYSFGKWVKLDQSFVESLKGYAKEVELLAGLEGLRSEIKSSLEGLESDPTFNGKRVITRSGLPAVNVNTETLLTFMEAFFFPAVPPKAAISGGGTRAFGASTALTINWTATKETYIITGITVAGDPVTPTGNTQSGSVIKNATANVNTTFTLSVTANGVTVSASTTLSWSLERFWGRSLKDGINQAITDADILALNGASSGSGYELSSSRVQTRASMNGAGQYLVFAFPSSAGVPTFTVNNLLNSAWTRVRANSPFTNSFGYTYNIDVWVSNTPQNSPLNIALS